MAGPPDDLEIRLLRPGDDPDAQLDLSERAFGPGSAADHDRRIRSLSRLIAGGQWLGSAFWWLTQERDADIAHRSRWMLRVVDAGRARAGRAVRRDAPGHAAPGRAGFERDAGRRRGPGCRLRRHALHARRLLTDTPPALRAAPPAGR
jgi:hypothetical protein